MPKNRKNVISCVTVHDSPDSDPPSNISTKRQHGNHHGDSKVSLESHGSGNPRTIIVPPLKKQPSEVLVECDSLLPDTTTSHTAPAYKSKPSSSSLVSAANSHSSGGSSGAISYRHQRLGVHTFQQQQPLNLSQAPPHLSAERTVNPRRQQAYIAPTIAQAPYSFPHSSPSHGAVHPHLATAHLPSQPHLYTYTAPAALGSTGTVAHLVASQGAARHAAYPTSIVHQVPVSMAHRVLPSPTIHPSQYQAQFAHQTYIRASPTSAVFAGFPLSPTKVNQYPFL